MKISIITPSYNQGSFIEDAIQSVLDQGYPDFEHIIIDGASTDDTVQRLKKYPHLKWVSEPDTGQSNALNKGFKLASGDIVGWLNCDDFYLKGTFKKVAEEFKDSSLSGVYSDLQFCNEQKEIVKYFKSNKPSKTLALFHTYITSETLFFKKSIIDKHQGVQEDLHTCMDQEFICKILYYNYKLKYVKDCFSVFRWQGNNKTLDSPAFREKRSTEGLKIFNKYNTFIKLDPYKKLNHKFYAVFVQLLRPYKIFLRITS